MSLLITFGFSLLACVAAYFAGALPSGYLIGKVKGIDIRAHGSGNMGATNVLRVLGAVWGGLVLAVDVLKGLAAVVWIPRLTPFPEADFLQVACGLAAILGHTYTVFLNLKGGKGVATTFGVFLGLAPLSTLAVFAVFLLVVLTTRLVSLGSLVSALIFPAMIWLLGESGRGFSVLILAVMVALIISVRHQSNIRRILDGKEAKLGENAPPGNRGPA
jgi:glycerol-3-phosphate acyltransferase PlsY